MIHSKKMTQEHFRQALSIIQDSENVKVSFNVPINDSYSQRHDILIHNSNATLVKQLVEAGFSLSMCENGLSVYKLPLDD